MSYHSLPIQFNSLLKPVTNEIVVGFFASQNITSSKTSGLKLLFENLTFFLTFNRKRSVTGNFALNLIKSKTPTGNKLEVVTEDLAQLNFHHEEVSSRSSTMKGGEIND